MNKSPYSALLIIAVLLPVTGFADEAKSAKGTPTTTTVSFDTLLTEPKYASRWYLLPVTETAQYTDDWPTPIADLNFQDASTMARVSRMRKLSLLTLAQSGQSRLFLGVNEEGLVGVHFSAFSLRNDGDYLELVRLPYLKKLDSAGNIDRD